MALVLTRAMRETCLRAVSDPVHEHRAGILLSRDAAGVLRAVSTDGHRLHIVEDSLDARDGATAESAFVPTWLVNAAVCACVTTKHHSAGYDTLGVGVHGSTLRVCGSTDVVIEATNTPAPDAFPNWQQVVSALPVPSALVTLSRATVRAVLAAAGVHDRVRFAVVSAGSAWVTAIHDTAEGSAESSVSTAYPMALGSTARDPADGRTMSCASVLSARYFRDVAASWKGDLQLDLPADPRDPVRITPRAGGGFAVVMPMSP